MDAEEELSKILTHEMLNAAIFEVAMIWHRYEGELITYDDPYELPDKIPTYKK